VRKEEEEGEEEEEDYHLLWKTSSPAWVYVVAAKARYVCHVTTVVNIHVYI
jgi:hypothetical protein